MGGTGIGMGEMGGESYGRSEHWGWEQWRWEIYEWQTEKLANLDGTILSHVTFVARAACVVGLS